MDKKQLGTILLVVGFILVLISLFADRLGLGEGGFGPKQGAGVAIGVALAILGWVWRKGGSLTLGEPSDKSPSDQGTLEV